MTSADGGASGRPDGCRIMGRLTPPLAADVAYLRSIGYTDTEIVRRGVALLAVHERQNRKVRV